MSQQKAKTGFKFVPSSYDKYEEIPEDWELEPLEKFLEVNMGQSPKSETYNLDGNGMDFYQGIAEFGRVYPTPQVWCTDPIKIAEPDQILLSVRAPVGEVNLSNNECCIGRGVTALKPINSDPKYCFFLLKYFRYRFSEFTRTTTYDSINQDGINQTRFPFIENIDEQREIGTILYNIENLIKETDSPQSQMVLLQKGLMQNLFMGKIRVKF